MSSVNPTEPHVLPDTRRRQGVQGRRAAALVLAMIVTACGGDTPSQPGPVGPPPPPLQPVNEAPVVESITLSGERAEIDSEVTATASVRDAETPVEQLKFEWRADVGSFSGEGRTVRWRAAKGVTTPADVILRLTVKEPYGNPDSTGARPEHAVSASSPSLRLHDSNREVSDLAMEFLGDFSNSSLSPEAAVRNFADSCGGKQAELEDIRKNREHYEIVQSRYSVQSVSVNGQRTQGNVTAQCEFTSRVVKCHPEIANCSVGMTVPVQGVCAIETRYEQRRWWLCESRFLNPTLTMRAFFFGR